MRIKDLSIQDFRGFRRFEMNGLGRINLIVGTNNSGKTTALEAINVLMTDFGVVGMVMGLNRRGEIIWPTNGQANANAMQFEVRRLFRGHEIQVGSTFRLSAETDQGGREVTAKIKEYSSDKAQPLDNLPLSLDSAEAFLPPLLLSLLWSPGSSEETLIPINRRGDMSLDAIRALHANPRGGCPLRSITASSSTAEDITSIFEEIVLTPEEDWVTDTLRIIEPAIQRIAASPSERLRPGMIPSTHSGLLVRLEGVKDRVPIGSMGDGIWRMLGLALNIVRAKGGILLVDDIDTGLHYTVMEDMWKFLDSATKTYNVQVFATTHSRDCYESLATIAHGSDSDTSEVTIQRIERGREKAVAYTEGHILAAAKHDIEVR